VVGVGVGVEVEVVVSLMPGIKSNRTNRHSYLRTLCTEFIRNKYPVIYRVLSKRAAEQYPTKKEKQ
jgi:hypothetical protein